MNPAPARRAAGPRTRARRLALQALYQWQVTGQPLRDVESQFAEELASERVDRDHFAALLRGVVEHVERLDALIGPLLDRPLGQVDPVERAALRIGACELLLRPEVPYRVAVNEAVELTKVFGSEEGHRYVNGVLDALARRLRPGEAKASARSTEQR